MSLWRNEPTYFYKSEKHFLQFFTFYFGNKTKNLLEYKIVVLKPLLLFIIDWGKLEQIWMEVSVLNLTNFKNTNLSNLSPSWSLSSPSKTS